MNFRQMLARYVTGNLPSEQLPELGVVGLEEGLDSPSLRVLAGFNGSESPFVLERYRQRVLDELVVELPSKRRAALEYAAAIADEVLTGQRQLVAGIRELFRGAIDTWAFPTRRYVHDGVGLSKVYALLVRIDDLSANHDELSEAETQLRDALRAWREELARRHFDLEEPEN